MIEFNFLKIQSSQSDRYLQLISEADVEVRLTCILFNGHQGVIYVVARALPMLQRLCENDS